VRFSSKKLPEKPFGIGEQLPKEWVEKRKILMPKMREAKKDGHRTKFVKDKLYINGQLYRMTETHTAPQSVPMPMVQ
jgi:hypothetical protein